MAVSNDTVIELNRSPFNAMIYVASLKRLISGANLLDAGRISFAPPESEALGPVKHDDDLIMLSQVGHIYRLSLSSFLRNGTAGVKE
jgi:hypothetical protein